MSEPVDMRKYNFVNMSIKEQWSMFVPLNSELSQKENISPEGLKGMSTVTATVAFNQRRIDKWLGDYRKQIEIAAISVFIDSASLCYSNSSESSPVVLL